MILSPIQYNRVEFTSDLGLGEVVIAFVDFSVGGISFGIPHHVRILEGTPEEPSDDVAIEEYERITIHADGKVVTHWALPPGSELKAPWDKIMNPLSAWDAPWSMREGLSWAPDYIKFTSHYYTKPKPLSHQRCSRVSVVFEDNAKDSAIFFAVVKPTSSLNQVQRIIPFGGQVYVLNSGWPWVLVAISNVKTPQIVKLASVGRDYR
jgi:hypothetical protein